MAEIEMLWLSPIKIWSVRFTSESAVFFVTAGWIAKRFFMLFFVYIAVYWHGLNKLSMKCTGYGLSTN